MTITPDICSIITRFIYKPEYKLLDWIDKNKLTNKILLSGNIKAINLLEEYPEKINWDLLSFNPNAIKILEKNPDKIN
jgi:hypothetical protein